MEEHVKERFERIEKNLETASEYLVHAAQTTQEASTISRENQMMTQALLAVYSEDRERNDSSQ